MKWKIWVPGTKMPVATSVDPRRSHVNSTLRSGEHFTWDRWDFEEIRLTQAAALLTLQGMPIKNLFTNAILAEPPSLPSSVRVHVHPGPFIYLRGTYRSNNGPPRLDKVVLARLRPGAQDLSQEAVLGTLVEAALHD